ncbi:MAG: PQQ-binding-like beta-propeller repeat protein [Phycisphaeraceae bacterium]
MVIAHPPHSARRILAVLLSLLLTGVSAAADWPTYRRDNHRSGHSEERLPVQRLHEAWRYVAAHAPRPAWEAPARWDAFAAIRGLSSMREYDPVYHVIVVDDRVYFGSSSDDSVHALDTAAGRTQWTFTADGPVRIAPTYDQGRLYFGSDDGHAYCINAATGLLIWRVRAADDARHVLNNQRMISLHPVRSGVLVEQGVAWFAGSLVPWEPSYLCAVDAKTGAIEGDGRFRRKLTGQYTLEAPLLSWQSKLIAPQGRVAPLLFDRATGAPQGALAGGGGSFVAVTPDGRVIVGPGNKTGWISENDPASRKRVANHERAIAAVFTADTAFLLSDSTLAAVDLKQRKTAWVAPCDCPLDIIVAGDHVYVGGADRVAAFEAATGKRVWQAKVLGRAQGLAAASGALFVSTDEGVIHCFKPGDKPAPPVDNAHRLSEALPPPPAIEPIKDDKLLGRWVFQSDQIDGGKLKDLATGKPATIQGTTTLEAWGPFQALAFDGKANEVVVTDDHTTRRTPVEAFTVEAWVRVDQGADWGGFVGIVQDNGDYERGWILGHNKANFTFAVASEAVKKLTYLPSGMTFEAGVWAHVAGTYDGKVMRIYVNGQLEGESKAQRGPIAYPPKALYTLGSYHDQDEFHKLNGAMNEVRVYERALTGEEIARSYMSKRRGLPEPAEEAVISFGPVLRFTAPDRAIVQWETPEPCPTKLHLREGQDRRAFDVPQKRTKHEVELTGLRRNRLYEYTITTTASGKPADSKAFECDTHFNYTEPVIAASDVFADDKAVRDAAAKAIAAAGVDHGVAVVFGVADRGRFAFELARQSSFHVLCVDTDQARVNAARKALLAAKVYGPRVSVLHIESWNDWPLRGDLANIVIAPRTVPASIVDQVLRPAGGVAFIDGEKARIRPQLEGAGIWSHQYGLPNNTAFGGETLTGARTTGALAVQWLGKPGPRAQVDRQPRKPSPLAVNGRLFIQGFRRLTALDAYNGSILWSLETPPIIRFNVPRDCSNWCADDEAVFVAAGDCVWRIDARTGELKDAWPVATRRDATKPADFGCVMRVGDQLIGSTTPREVSHRKYWTKEAWYDSPTGVHAAKICSDQLFALDPRTGSRRWVYTGGLIINSTIAATPSHLYFIESRDPAARAREDRRLDGNGFWSSVHLICLDAATGDRRWEQPLKIEPGSVSIQLAVADEMIVVGCSHQKQYHTYAFSEKDGSETWRAADNWFDGKDQGAAHHGTHLSRPTIVAGRVIVRPWLYDLKTGAKLQQRMPVIKEGHGCGTYAACATSIIFRSGDMAMWDFESASKTLWPRLRPDCWLSTVPALGMILSPEAGGGCSCGSWMETSIGFIPVPIVAAQP